MPGAAAESCDFEKRRTKRSFRVVLSENKRVFCQVSAENKRRVNRNRQKRIKEGGRKRKK